MNCVHCGQPLKDDAPTCGGCGRPTSTPSRRSGTDPTFIAVREQAVLEGKWRLERKIGEGGMGTVYLARDLQLDRLVAVKILSSTLASDPDVVARFDREARVTASLEHPHIVPVFAVGRFEGRPFMVMKNLEGDALAGVLRQRTSLPLSELLAVMRQVASALDFIHARGYVHRDVKTANIFVGPDGHATLLDFGILRPSRGADALTRAGVVMGTPQYMSPEQSLGVREVDHRADLYALAVVLFECLTGRLPFEADNELALIQMHAHAPPPELSQLAPWVPPAVGEVVRRALAKRPEDRFASAGELVTALEEASRSHGAAVPEPRLGAKTAPSWRRRGSGEASEASAAQTPGLQPPRGRARRRGAALAFVAALLVVAAGAFGIHWRDEPAPSTSDGSVAAAVEPDAAEPEAPVEPDAAVAAAVEVPAPREADGGALTEAAPARVEAPPPAPEPRRTRTGRVKVVSLHRGEPYWAQVFVDGEPRGRTPLALTLPAGTHLLRIERTGFRPVERRVRIAPGRTEVVRVALRP